MALYAATGTFNTGTGAVGSTVAVTGLGFTPKLVLFWWTGRTGVALGRADQRAGFGYAISPTDRGCAYMYSRDALGISDAGNNQSRTACVFVNEYAGGFAISGALDVRSLDADGFTLVVDDPFGANYLVHYWALGGAGILHVAAGTFDQPASAGAQAITGVGFLPHLLLLTSTGSVTGSAPSTIDSSLMIGAATASNNQYVTVGGANSAVTTTRTRSYTYNAECIALLDSTQTNTQARAALTSLDPDGFTLNWLEATAVARLIQYIAVQFADARSVVLGDLLTKTDLTPIVETGLGFSPVGALLISHGQALSTQDTPQAGHKLSIGAFTSAAAQHAGGLEDQNNLADSVVTTGEASTRVYLNLTTGAADGIMHVTSVDSDGFSCQMVNEDPTQAFVWYLAIGTPAPTWRTHPHTYRTFLFVHKPKPLLQALVNEPLGVTYPLADFDFDTASLNRLSGHEGTGWRWFMGATLSLGAAARGREKGLARLRNYGPTTLNVYTSQGILRGELNVVNNDHVTIWDSFEPWMKPARMSPSAGAYYKDYDPVAGAGLTVPNVGPGWAGLCDANRYVDLIFDAAQGYVTADMLLWGNYGTDLCSGGTPSASSANASHPASHAFDNNNSTYWQATGAVPQWLEYQFAAPQTVRCVRIRVFSTSTTPRNFTLQYYDGAAWQTVHTVTNESWLYWPVPPDPAHNPVYSYAIQTAHSATRWRINVTAINGAGPVAIQEVEMFALANTNVYEWQIPDDCTLISGTTASPQITVRCPVGFRHLHFTTVPSYDSVALRQTRHIPVFVGLPKAWDGLETDYSGGTPSASTADGAHPASAAFDNSDSTYWTTSAGSVIGWIRMLFPAKRTLGGYAVRAIADNASAAPNDWTFEGSQDAVSWSTLDTQTDQVFAAGELKSYPLSAAAQAYRYYRLNITQNNGHATLLGLAELDLLDGTDYDYFEHFVIESWTHTQQGQQLEIRVYDPLSKTDYPDHTLCMVWEDDYYNGIKTSLYGPADREQLKHIGWLGEQREEVNAGELYTEKATRITIDGMGYALGNLPAFSQVCERTSEQSYASGGSAFLLQHANVDRFAWNLLFWNSTLAELTDFWWSATGETYAFPVLSANGTNLWDQLRQACTSMAHFLLCDRYGRLYMRPDPLLQATGDRTATVIQALTEDDIVSIRYTRYAAPRAHWGWHSAIQALTEAADDTPTFVPLFSRAPGQVPGQGLNSVEFNEQIVVDQDQLDVRAGGAYGARQNPETSYLEVVLAHGGDAGWDPAREGWVTVTLSAAYAAQRGLTFTAARCLLLEVRWEYNAEKGTKRPVLILEPETAYLEGEPYTPA